MKFPLVTYGGRNFRLLLIRPNWATSPIITHRLDTTIGEGRTTIEERRPARASILLSQKFTISPVDNDADDWRKGIAALGKRYVAAPLWVDALPVASWSSRIYAPQKVINFDPTTGDYAIYDGAALPGAPAYPYYAPLMLGRWKKRPPASVDEAKGGDIALELVEARPWSWRIDVNAIAGASWTKLPNRASPVRDVSDYGLELLELPGAAAEPALDRENAAARWLQEGEFAFLGRTEIRTALSVFVDKHGSLESWAPVPAWFQPGADTADTPNNYTARFASDTLTLTYAAPDYATARVGFVQEISTPGRDQSQPGEAYLYRLSYDLDSGNPELFTNWDAPLVAAEGSYQPAQIAHTEILRSLKPQEERAEIQTAYVAGSLAADWMLARLFGVVRLTIWKCDPTNVGARSAIFSGIVSEIRPEGNTLTIVATLFGKMLERRVPGWVFGPGCNTFVFSGLCGLSEATHRSAGTAASADLSADGLTLTVHGVTGWGGPGYADNWFAFGMVRTGAGRSTQVARVLSSTMSAGNVVVKLNRRLWSDLISGAGQAVQLVPGCDGQKSTCVTKFNNYTPAGGKGFRGFPFIPDYIESRAAGSPKAPKK